MRRNIFRDLGVTKEELEDLYIHQNMTDAGIGRLKGVSCASVSYFRRKYGIPTKGQLDRLTFASTGLSFKDITPVELANLYASMSLRAIAKLYGISKPTVAAKCRAFGIQPLSKSDRATSKVAYTDLQKECLIGMLLGDGHLQERGVFKVTHYQEQLGYLMHTHRVLAPHTLPLFYEEKEMDNGRLTFAYGYRTTMHDWLRVLRNLFYPEGVKVFPSDILRNLTPRSLAYWYFDDGHLDGLPSIAIGSVADDEARRVASELSARFELDVYVKHSTGKCTSLAFKGNSAGRFFDLIKDFATEDLLYKFPPRHWPPGRAPLVPARSPEPYLLPSHLVAESRAWGALEPEDQALTVEALAQHWEKVGFPHHIPRPEELMVLTNLDPHQVIQNGVVKARQVGQSICQGFCPNIWSGRTFDGMSPLDIFKSPLDLRSVIRLCLTHGDVPNASRLRGMLRYWKRSGVYNFRPSAAKALVDTYCPVGGVVLDPCAGYGGRLLGAVLSKASPRYVGYEPSTETFGNLTRLHQWVSSFFPQVKDKVTIHPDPAEEAVFPEGVDVVLTSPPYWKREVYADEPTQSSAKYGDYSEWLERFWFKILSQSVSVLKPGGWLLVNVDDFSLGGRKYPLINDTLRFALRLGLGVPTRLVYELPGKDSSHEAVLCWARGPGFQSQGLLVAPLSLPRCPTCRRVCPSGGGPCVKCEALARKPSSCKGCGADFFPHSKRNLFHNEACRARYQRKQHRLAHPLSGIRTFKCKECLTSWSTTALGHFTLCPSCHEGKSSALRQKTCEYRHCGRAFVDTSPKNGMQYCSPEHRRREKLFRSGVAKDPSYFRKPDPCQGT